MLNLNDLEFKDELHTLEYKQDIARLFAEVNKLYQDNKFTNQRQKEFLILKDDVLEQINEVENKIYVKKLK